MSIQDAMLYKPVSLALEIDLHDLKTLDGALKFEVSHDEMVVKWVESTDRQLGLTKQGLCTSCCLVICIKTLKEVVTQVGAYRFGLRVGKCIPCIERDLKNGRLKSLTFNAFFIHSEDTHQISITLPLLKQLASRESAINEIEVGAPLSQGNKDEISQIIETHAPLVKQCEEEQARKYLCKICHRIKEVVDKPLNLNRLNSMRAQKIKQGCCLGCGTVYYLDKGCSIVTCTQCISRTVTCFSCMDGAVGFEHNLSGCTYRVARLTYDPENAEPLPPVLWCICPKDALNI